MAALAVGTELDFIDGEEGDPPVQRHGFDRADEIARMRRDDLLLAGDQRHLPGAPDAGDAVVILPRQQAQGKADHAGGMPQHPLDGEVGLAGIGRPQHGGDARTALAWIAAGMNGLDGHANLSRLFPLHPAIEGALQASAIWP